MSTHEPPNRPLRVAMVAARALPFVGGTETHVGEVSTRLARKGIDVTVLSTDVKIRQEIREVKENVTLRTFPAWPRSKDYYLSPGLWRVLRRENFDVVHIQGVHSTVPPIALAIALVRRLPTVVTFHTGGTSNKLRRVLRGAQWRVERPLLSRATKLIAVCEYEIEQFARILRVPRNRIALVRNGCGAFPQGDSDVDVSGEPLVLSIGRLVEYKGHHRVIEAMPSLLEKMSTAHLVIVGSGPFETQLRAQVRELRLSNSVSFMSFGPDQRTELGTLVRSADVAVLMSDYEAHPVAVMEALAEGVDVVVASTSGMTELAKTGLVRAIALGSSPQALAGEIIAAVAERRWKAENATLPSWDDCVDELLANYQEVTKCES